VTDYVAHDGEKFKRRLPARQHIADSKDVPHRVAETFIEEVEDVDDETLEVFEFRVVEHLAAEKTVKLKATSEDEAKERAKQALLGEKPEVTHTVHKEFHKLDKVDDVPRSKIESGEYYEDGDSA